MNDMDFHIDQWHNEWVYLFCYFYYLPFKGISNAFQL